MIGLIPLYYTVAVLSILGLSVRVQAETLEQKVLTELSAARSPAEVEEIRGFFERLRIARTACQIQLDGDMVPSVCYRVLQLELRLGLHKSPREQTRLKAHLDQLCAKASAKLNIESISFESVSPECRKKIAEAQKIQAYRASGGSVIEMN
jgi:hypothetical protein